MTMRLRLLAALGLIAALRRESRSTIFTPRQRAKARSSSMSAARPRRGRRWRKPSTNAIRASLSRSPAAFPTCSTRRSTRRLPPESLKSMPRSCRPSPISCAGKTTADCINFKPAGFDAIDRASRMRPAATGRRWSTPSLYVQHREGRRRRHAELGARFPKTAIPGQDRHRLSGGRRRHAVGVLSPSCRSTAGATWTSTWLPSQTSSKVIWRAAQHRLRPKSGDVRFDLQHHDACSKSRACRSTRISRPSTRRRSGRCRERSSREPRIRTRPSCS